MTSSKPAAVAEPAPQPSSQPPPRGGGWRAIFRLGLTRKQLLGLGVLVLAVHLPFVHYLLRGEAPVTVQLPFADDYSRANLGGDYFSTGGAWRIVDGMVLSPGVKNNPLWLKARLPAEVAVEFDVKSTSKDGDIKAEIFGNGRDHASGYVVVFGGWSNSTSVIARLDEHGRDRKEDRGLRVEPGRLYHFRIERRGGLLRWFVDGQLAMEYADPAPLQGKGHDRFGFSSWDSDIWFDNLTVRAL